MKAFARAACLCLFGVLAACGTATVERPNFQSVLVPQGNSAAGGHEPSPQAARQAQDPVVPGPSYAAIVSPLPAMPAVTERLARPAVPKPFWRAECGASNCYRIITFDDGQGWDYVAGSLRVPDDGGGLQLKVSSSVARVRARVDKGEVFAFRCSAGPATCSLTDAEAGRLARALRRGRKLLVEVKVDQIQRKRIGVHKDERLQRFPARVVRRELDLSSFRAPLRNA